MLVSGQQLPQAGHGGQLGVGSDNLRRSKQASQLQQRETRGAGEFGYQEEKEEEEKEGVLSLAGQQVCWAKQALGISPTALALLNGKRKIEREPNTSKNILKVSPPSVKKKPLMICSFIAKLYTSQSHRTLQKRCALTASF